MGCWVVIPVKTPFLVQSGFESGPWWWWPAALQDLVLDLVLPSERRVSVGQDDCAWSCTSQPQLVSWKTANWPMGAPQSACEVTHEVSTSVWEPDLKTAVRWEKSEPKHRRIATICVIHACRWEFIKPFDHILGPNWLCRNVGLASVSFAKHSNFWSVWASENHRSWWIELGKPKHFSAHVF